MIAYAVAIEPGTETTAWGTVVPDLPGCFSAGGTLEEALRNTQHAAEAWIDAVVEDGSQIPAPSPMAEHYVDPEYSGWTWALIQIDPARMDNTVERVNITLPRRILARLDAYAESTGKSRSGRSRTKSTKPSRDADIRLAVPTGHCRDGIPICCSCPAACR